MRCTEELLSNSRRLTAGTDNNPKQPGQDQDGNQEHIPAMQSGIAAMSSQSDDDIEGELDSGVEVERDDPEIKIERPFDPEKIKVRTANIVVEQLVARIKYDEINLEPPFPALVHLENGTPVSG